MVCLGCGNENANYCEDCIQKILSQNIRLQYEVNKLKEKLEKFENNIDKN